MEYKDILEKAFEAMDNAYAPYSKYHVGACVKTVDGKYFLGANIENAAYGPTVCGERNAIFAAYSNGYRKEDIESIAIVSNGKKLGTPCGVCRQVLSELISVNTPIVLSNKLEKRVMTIDELLPYSFSAEDLNEKI